MYNIAVLEYLGIFAFAASDAFVAIREKFDLFAIYILDNGKRSSSWHCCKCRNTFVFLIN